jgi:hypothetical protein
MVLDAAGAPEKRFIPLREVVQRYRSLAGGFGKPVALRAFDLDRQTTEHLFSAFDEDYHISRFFHFSLDSAAGGHPYAINGFPQSHVWLDGEVETIL